MKYELKPNIDSLEYGIYDEKNDEFLTDTDDIESFIESNKPKAVAKAIVNSIKMLVDDLKEQIGCDLQDCYKRK